jgi:DNA-directed RNA polymerase specialized sigma24 family protein
MRVADHVEPDPHWPEKILQLCHQLPDVSSVTERNRVLGDLWVLANLAISRYVRYHAHTSPVDPEDVKDIASEKAMAFLQHANEPAWTNGGTHPGQVCSYFSTLAHNGLMDHFRSRRRWVEPSALDVVRESGVQTSPHPESQLVRRQFVEALRDCAGELTPKARIGWFLRVMLNMSSRDIAQHPSVQMNVAAVDMMLSRARKTISDRMREKGFDPQEIPPGTLALLWMSVRRELEDEAKSD